MLVISIFSEKIFVFLLFILLGIYVYLKTKKKMHKLFINYNFFAIVFLILISLTFSHLIKPILYYRYFYVVFPCYLSLIVLFVGYKFKNKFGLFLNVLFFVLFLISSRISYQNLFCNHSLYLDFVKNDLDKTKTNYIFMTDTVKDYKEFKIDNVNQIYLPVNSGITVFEIEKYDIRRPAVLYVLNLYLSDETYKIAKKIELFKTTLGVFCKVEI